MDINLSSDSPAGLKTLDSCVDNSKTIMDCRKSLNEMAKHYKITVMWDPRPPDIEGNYIADEWARKGTTIKILQEKDTIGMPIATCRLLIKQKTLRQAEPNLLESYNQIFISFLLLTYLVVFNRLY